MPNRRQVIIWTKADPFHRCIYVALGELKRISPSHCNAFIILYMPHLSSMFSNKTSRLNSPHSNAEVNSLWPGDAIWWRGTRSTLAQWHQATTWTNADFSFVRSHGIHQGALSLEDLKKPINKTRLKIAVLKWHPSLPGANELNYTSWFLVSTRLHLQHHWLTCMGN